MNIVWGELNVGMEKNKKKHIMFRPQTTDALVSMRIEDMITYEEGQSFLFLFGPLKMN